MVHTVERIPLYHVDLFFDLCACQAIKFRVVAWCQKSKKSELPLEFRVELISKIFLLGENYHLPTIVANSEEFSLHE